MNFKRLPGMRLLVGTLFLMLVGCACDSPLEVETPRNRYADNVSVLPTDDIGSAISVELPTDTTGVDSSWQAAHFSAALVLDGSLSISSEMNRYLRQAGNTFLDSLDGAIDEGLVVHITSVATIYQHLTTKVTALRTAVNALPMTGATALWDGMYYAMLELNTKGPHTRKAIIVITDSDDNSSTLGSPSAILDYAHRHDIAVYVITMRLTSHELSLRNIAEQTGGRHYSQPLLSSLDGIYREIAALLRRP